MIPTLRGFAAMLATALLAGCALPGLFQSDPIHLVIDAGSTGTRFCLYGVSRDAAGACQVQSLPAPYDTCRPVRAPNGLADLGPERAVQVVEQGLADIDAATRARIAGGALLGTGGFRRQAEAHNDAVFRALRARFADRIGTMRVLTGEMEAELAWESMRQVGATRPLSIIETGGATVQFASGDDARRLAAVSAPIGMTTAYRDVLRRAERECIAEEGRQPAFAACRAFIAGSVFGGSPLERFMAAQPADVTDRQLHGMGAPWGAIFRFGGRDRFTAAELAAAGESICATPVGALRAKFGDEWDPRRLCFLFAYQSAFLEAVRGREIAKGDESWPRGAAGSHAIFGSCGG